MRYQHEMNFSDVPNITADYSPLDDVMKEENFVLWMTKALTLSTTILSVLGLLSDAIAFRISWGLPEKKSAKSLMQMQAAADCFQSVFLFLGAIWRLKGFTITDYDSNLSCKFHKFSYTFGPHVVALTTSCIAADRLVAVMFPIQYKNHATEAKGYLVGSVAMLLGFFIASPWLALSQLVADKCIIGEWNDVVYQLHAYAIIAYIPISAICTLAAVLTIIKRKVSSGSTTRKTNTFSKRDKEVTAGLIALCCVFIVTETGYSVLQMGAKTGWNSTVDVSQSMSKFLLALSAFCLVVNSVATAPIYLCITPMRQALFKTSSQPTSNNQV